MNADRRTCPFAMVEALREASTAAVDLRDRYATLVEPEHDKLRIAVASAVTARCQLTADRDRLLQPIAYRVSSTFNRSPRWNECKGMMVRSNSFSRSEGLQFGTMASTLELLRQLSTNKVDFILVGGMAAIAHG